MNGLKELRACLTEHRAEILVKWEQSLTEDQYFVSFQFTGNVKDLLSHILNDVSGFLEQDEFLYTRPHIIDIPLSAPRNEVAIIVRGEEVVVEIVRRYLAVSDDDWLFVRKKINQAFHEILSTYVRDACDMCRSAAHEKLSQTLGLKELLEKSLPRKDCT
jgi:hypothetical protein